MSGQSMRDPAARYAEPATEGDATEQLASIVIQVPRLCRRFGARLVRGIGPAPAPERVRRRLAAIGAQVDLGRGRRHELRALGRRPAAPRLRLRQARRGPAHRPQGAARREARHARRSRARARALRRRRRRRRARGLARRHHGRAGHGRHGEHEERPARSGLVGPRHGAEDRAPPRACTPTPRTASSAAPTPKPFPMRSTYAARLIVEAAGGTMAPGLLDARGARPAGPEDRAAPVAAPPALRRRAAEPRLRRGRPRAGWGSRRSGEASTSPSRSRSSAATCGARTTWSRKCCGSTATTGCPRASRRRPRPAGTRSRAGPIEERLADAAAAAGLFETVNYPFVDRDADESALGRLAAADGDGSRAARDSAIRWTHPATTCARRCFRACSTPCRATSATARRRSVSSRSAALSASQGESDRPESFESRRFAFALGGREAGPLERAAAAAAGGFLRRKGLVGAARRAVDPGGGARLEARGDRGLHAPGVAPSPARAPAKSSRSSGLLAESERERRRPRRCRLRRARSWSTRCPWTAGRFVFEPSSSLPPIIADLSFAQPRDLAWARLEEFVRGLASPTWSPCGCSTATRGREFPAGSSRRRSASRSARSNGRSTQAEVNREVRRSRWLTLDSRARTSSGQRRPSSAEERNGNDMDRPKFSTRWTARSRAARA